MAERKNKVETELMAEAERIRMSNEPRTNAAPTRGFQWPAGVAPTASLADTAPRAPAVGARLQNPFKDQPVRAMTAAEKLAQQMRENGPAPLPAGYTRAQDVVADMARGRSPFVAAVRPAVRPANPAEAAAPMPPAGPAEAQDYGADVAGRPVIQPVAPAQPARGWVAEDWTDGTQTVAQPAQPAEQPLPRAGAMDMTSPAAARLAEQMGMQRFFSLANQTGNTRLRDFIRTGGQAGDEATRARWQAAYDAAVEANLSPRQRAQKRIEEQQAAVRAGAAFEAGPEGIQSRRAARTARDVARFGAEGAAGKVAADREVAGMESQGRLALEAQKAQGEERRAREAREADERKSASELTLKRADAIGNQLTKLYGELTAAEGTQAQGAIQKRIQTLEGQQAKLLGVEDTGGATANTAKTGGTVRLRGPSGQMAMMTPQAAQKYLSRPGYSLVQ